MAVTTKSPATVRGIYLLPMFLTTQGIAKNLHYMSLFGLHLA
jgi:hypothetical protein